MVRMDGAIPHFSHGNRVRLRPTVDPAIYGDYAVVGNEGMIEEVRKDRFDLPEVFVRWDKNHWAYNGIEDCWTFEDHFELVEDDMASKKDKVENLLAMFAEGLGQLLAEDAQPAPAPEPKAKQSLTDVFRQAAATFSDAETDADTDTDFSRAVEAATSRLRESDAFVIVGIDRHNDPRAPEGILEPFGLSYSKSPEGEVLLTAHMARLAAMAHQDLALATIGQMDHE